MKFQPGNQLAKNRDRNSERRFKAALNNAIEKNPERLDRIAERLLAAAEGGDMVAIKEFADRLDGKAAQSVDVDGTTTLRIERIEYVVVEAPQPTPRLINGNGHYPQN